ncbi:unnamed protein product [Ilex paraguariensis]|uniref:USP domain-containing protein n=1 Tax=Ilex paraguariensis TaxID=185542 RepID=A0ABC8UFH2_9AQUA
MTKNVQIIFLFIYIGLGTLGFVSFLCFDIRRVMPNLIIETIQMSFAWCFNLFTVSGELQEEREDLGILPTDVPVETVGGSSMFFGTGMRNCGENNCFINATIQSLWHLKWFRDELLSLSEHEDVGDPCVVCALRKLFETLSMANTDGQRKAVSPTSLRTALSILYPANVNFLEGREGEAYEVLESILCCLHDSFIHTPGISDAKSLEKKGAGSSHCPIKTCIAHTFFGLDDSCMSESQNKNAYFHFKTADELRKIMDVCGSLDEPLKHGHIQLVCIDGVGGGRKRIRIKGVQSTPHVFALVIGWGTNVIADDILTTLIALNTEVEIVFLDQGNKHCLVSMACYCQHHYYCFAYNHEHERWIMFEDENVKDIGSWDNLVSTCENRLLLPAIALFEAVD